MDAPVTAREARRRLCEAGSNTLVSLWLVAIFRWGRTDARRTDWAMRHCRFGRSRTLEDELIETTLYSLAPSAPKRPERRTSERFLSLLRVGAIVVGGRRELCLIRNISAGGMMIRAYSVIAEGTRLSIELKQGEAVKGLVQWIDDELIGVAFDAPIDVVSLLGPSGEGQRPRLPRVEVSCTAWVREGAQMVRARTVNISPGGICVETPATLTDGASVVVSLNGLSPVAGLVRWSADGAYGIGFNRALAVADLVGWLQSQQREQRRSAVN
jgi:PilZ domain-containing protein